MLDKVIFAQNMAGLCEVYNRELTKTLQNIYYAILKDMEDDDFKQAIKRLLQERVCATFPKPAEILELTNIVKVERTEVCEYTIEARRLIDLVRAINDQVFKDSEKMSRPFSDLIRVIILEQMISEKDLAIISTVRPHRNAKLLIGEINTYADGEIQLQAFIDALKYQPSDAIQIANPIQNLRIKR